MNRVAFARASGIVVDVRGAHGTWFDAGELTRAVVFVVATPEDEGNGEPG